MTAAGGKCDPQGLGVSGIVQEKTPRRRILRRKKNNASSKKYNAETIEQ
jgi:hypothetical protein